MNATEERARELFAAALEDHGQSGTARVVLAGDSWQGWVAPVVKAGVAAVAAALREVHNGRR